MENAISQEKCNAINKDLTKALSNIGNDESQAMENDLLRASEECWHVEACASSVKKQE